MSFLIAALTKTAIDYLICGSASAISLYCGVKLPRNKRR